MFLVFTLTTSLYKPSKFNVYSCKTKFTLETIGNEVLSTISVIGIFSQGLLVQSNTNEYVNYA